MTKYGTLADLLSRRDGWATSVDAAASIDTTRLERVVHDAIRAHGAKGCIAADLLRLFSGLAYSSVTARFSALERKGLIVRGPDRREGPNGRGQMVMRSAEHGAQ